MQLALARCIFDRQHQRLRLQHSIEVTSLGRHPGLATDQTLAAQLQQPATQFQFTVGQLLPRQGQLTPCQTQPGNSKQGAAAAQLATGQRRQLTGDAPLVIEGVGLQRQAVASRQGALVLQGISFEHQLFIPLQGAAVGQSATLPVQGLPCLHLAPVGQPPRLQLHCVALHLARHGQLISVNIQRRSTNAPPKAHLLSLQLHALTCVTFTLISLLPARTGLYR